MSTDPASQIRQILAACAPAQRDEIIRLLRIEYRAHRIEREWNTSAEVVLEALARAGELTKRMFKGILAEAAFKVEIVDKLAGWRDVTPSGIHAFDFVVQRGDVRARVQTKLQRKAGGKPFLYRIPGRRGPATALYVVETQKSRRGTDRTSGANTRPYKFGEFDILAVSMEPVTGDWSQFRFTVADWLIPGRRPRSSSLCISQWRWTPTTTGPIRWPRPSNGGRPSGRKRSALKRPRTVPDRKDERRDRDFSFS